MEDSVTIRRILFRIVVRIFSEFAGSSLVEFCFKNALTYIRFNRFLIIEISI